MDEKELSKFYYLKKEIKDLKQRIDEFGDGVKSMQINEVSVSSSHKNISIQEKRMELISLWIEKRILAIEECLKIERFIDEVDDPEIRQIMRYRFIDFMKWDEIGKKVFQERTSVAKKLRKYLKDVN